MARPSAVVSLLTHWPWTSEEVETGALTRERATERVESYVYGNVLVLAATAATSAASVRDGQAVLLVIGTAVSTFVAHLLAVSVAHAHPDQKHQLGESVRDSVPIATSALLPALVLLAGWWGWLSPTTAITVALASTVVRFVLFGSVVSHLLGLRSTWRNVLIGVGLGLAAVAVAAFKLVLTH